VLGLITAHDPLTPRAIVMCMGAEQADYRVELYEPYHAHRDPMPPELAQQWIRVQDLVESLDWTYATSETLEADDVMLSHARLEEEKGGRAVLLTADRDLFGAVSDRVAVLELHKGGGYGLIGPDGVRERYGIGPDLVPDLIALRGDPSDGIPGAPGVGAKTAAALLKEHGSLEEVLRVAALSASGALAGPGRIRPRIAGVLADNDALLRDFKHVATLQRFDVKRPADRETDFAGGAGTAAAMGMRRLAERLTALATP